MRLIVGAALIYSMAFFIFLLVLMPVSDDPITRKMTTGILVLGLLLNVLALYANYWPK